MVLQLSDNPNLSKHFDKVIKNLEQNRALYLSLMSCKFAYSKDVETACVDSNFNVLIGDGFGEYSVGESSYILVHELMHSRRRHHERFRSLITEVKDIDKWNVATDCEINATLDAYYSQYNIVPPSSRILLANVVSKIGGTNRHNNMFLENNPPAEFIYYYLESREQSLSDGKKISDYVSTDGAAGGKDLIDQSTADAIREKLAKAGAEFNGASGSKEAEKQFKKVLGIGNSKDYTYIHDMCSNGDGIFETSFIEEMYERTSNQSSMAYGMDDYTYMTPSRRSVNEIILPSTVKKEIKICLILDISVSMDSADVYSGYLFYKYLSCIYNADLIPCNTVPSFLHTNRGVLPENLPIGGGTDMYSGIKLAYDNNYDLIIVFTDGDTPYGRIEEMGLSNLVFLLTQGKSTNVPDWITYYDITDKLK